MVEDKRKAMQGHAAFDESESETRMASLEGTMYLKRKVGTMVRWSLSLYTPVIVWVSVIYSFTVVLDSLRIGGFVGFVLVFLRKNIQP